MQASLRCESGRSSAWLERLLWEQEVARSNRVAPTLKQGSQFNRELRAFFRLSRSLASLRCATEGEGHAVAGFEAIGCTEVLGFQARLGAAVTVVSFVP